MLYIMYYKGYEGSVVYKPYRAPMVGHVRGVPLRFCGWDVLELADSFHKCIDQHLKKQSAK